MTRPDKTGPQRSSYESNKKKILKLQSVCGICGKPVDKRIKYPDPMCAVIDHIIPVSKGGHPSDINNLQLAHNTCNRNKSDKTYINLEKKDTTVLGNRNLPQSHDWLNYKLE